MIDLLEYFDNHVEGTYYERFCTIIQRVDDEGSVVFGLEPSILEYKFHFIFFITIYIFDSSQNFLNDQRVCWILLTLILGNMLLIMDILMEI